MLRSPIPVEVDVPDERFPPAIEAAAYYVAAEALANVAKYAGATFAQVRVVEDEEEAAIVVEVVDDGVGGADPARGSGLEGLEDRVETLDGALQRGEPAGRRHARARDDPDRSARRSLSAPVRKTAPEKAGRPQRIARQCRRDAGRMDRTRTSMTFPRVEPGTATGLS